jgi:hypothetical protein
MNLKSLVPQSSTKALGIHFDWDLNGYTLPYSSLDLTSVDMLSAYSAGDETAG